MRISFLQILLIFSWPEGYRLQFSIPRAYFMYTVRHCTGQHCSSIYVCTYWLFASTWLPLVSVITILYYTMLHVCMLFSALHKEYLTKEKFGHHPHPLGYLFAKFCFFCSLRCWTSMPQEPKLALRNSSLLMSESQEKCSNFVLSGEW